MRISLSNIIQRTSCTISGFFSTSGCQDDDERRKFHERIFTGRNFSFRRPFEGESHDEMMTSREKRTSAIDAKWFVAPTVGRTRKIKNKIN